MRYQRYTKPNMAIAEELWGVKYISYDRSGCPRCSCNGRGATSKKDSAVSNARRYVGLTSSTRKTRSRDARINAPATSPVMNGYKTISTCLLYTSDAADEEDSVDL